MNASVVSSVGAVCFGIVIGYVTYRALARSTGNDSISDLAAVVGAVGGAVVTGLYAPGTDLFGWYAIGLPLGMATYLLLFRRFNGDDETARVLGSDDPRPR